MSRLTRHLIIGAVGAVALMSAGPGTASAREGEPCAYPQVCFYTADGHIAGRFEDVTPGFQELGPSTAATHVVNTRRDDTVFIEFTDHRGDGCLEPGWSWTWSLKEAAAIRVRISDSPTCPPLSRASF